MNTKSQRFTPTGWSNCLVPVLLSILLFALLAALVIVGLSMLGITPGW